MFECIRNNRKVVNLRLSKRNQEIVIYRASEWSGLTNSFVSVRINSQLNLTNLQADLAFIPQEKHVPYFANSEYSRLTLFDLALYMHLYQQQLVLVNTYNNM